MFYKFIKKNYFQEGFGRLWRGTNAGLALAVPTVSFSHCSLILFYSIAIWKSFSFFVALCYHHQLLLSLLLLLFCHLVFWLGSEGVSTIYLSGLSD